MVFRMKTVIGLAFLGFAINSVTCAKMDFEGLKEMLKPMKASCLKKIGPDRALLNEHRTTGVVSNDPTVMCYYKCLLIMAKAMKNGEILYDSITGSIDILVQDDLAKRMKDTIAKCGPDVVTSKEPCEAAWQYTNCYWLNGPDLYLYDD